MFCLLVHLLPFFELFEHDRVLVYLNFFLFRIRGVAAIGSETFFLQEGALAVVNKERALVEANKDTKEPVTT